jgi:hypothetical protein
MIPSAVHQPETMAASLQEREPQAKNQSSLPPIASRQLAASDQIMSDSLGNGFAA